MNQVIGFSIRNRFYVVLVAVLLIAAGFYSAATLPIDAVPDITTKQVVVNTSAPALSPEEIERQITTPLEVALSGLPHAVGMRSISQFGLSQVTVEFEDHTDIYFARQLVHERVAEMKDQLPAGAEPPSLAPIATGLGEIYYVFVEGNEFTLMERRAILDWQVKPRLRTVPGIIEVNTFGGHEKQYQVEANPDKLRAHGVTLATVREALERTTEMPAGPILPKKMSSK